MAAIRMSDFIDLQLDVPIISFVTVVSLLLNDERLRNIRQSDHHNIAIAEQEVV